LQPPAPARLDEQLDLVFDIDHLPAGHRHSWPGGYQKCCVPVGAGAGA
jgi:hypothetical protein